ncbi:MAG: RluA family pseudouridine synthase [Helicobacteraceae bacterium]|jgi:23S rRNA-/tRNA-specific pseudouridylate synthase|nr:RluA family pseudouridine synthase [Helicobacteraceae bacterium]
MNEKAYKLLALQEGISNGEAKQLIDNGFVFVGGNKLTIARKEVERSVSFKVMRPKPPKPIAEDDELLAIDKPIGSESYALERQFGLKLIHRLDKQTSGVLLLAKNDEFLRRAIDEFKARRVEKRYLAVVGAIVSEEMTIDLPIYTQKGAKAKSVIDKRRGQEAITIAKPLRVANKRTLLELTIPTGRTHQIRVHLSHAGLPILGDEVYGGKAHSRLMLHSSFISLLGREIRAKTPSEFLALFDGD